MITVLAHGCDAAADPWLAPVRGPDTRIAALSEPEAAIALLASLPTPTDPAVCIFRLPPGGDPLAIGRALCAAALPAAILFVVEPEDLAAAAETIRSAPGIGNGVFCATTDSESFQTAWEGAADFARRALRFPRPPAARCEPEILAFRALMEYLPDHVYFKDRSSRFVRVNRGMAQFVGAQRVEDVIGKTDHDFFGKRHADEALRDEQRILETGAGIIDKEELENWPDGHITWAQTTKLPLRDENGRIVGTFGISKDITARKRAERALEEERLLLRTLINILPARIFAKDAQFRYIINNNAHIEWLGATSPGDILGKAYPESLQAEVARRLMEDDRRVIVSGDPILNREELVVSPTGEKRWNLTNKVPLRDSSGNIKGLVGMSLDITARKRMEEEIRAKNAQMEAELTMAREIQQALLPHAYPSFPRGAEPARSTLRFAHRYLPSSVLAGDFFDILQLSDTAAGILICDVMGHGVQASLIAALLRGIEVELMAIARDPSAFLTGMNQTLTRTLQNANTGSFATAFYAVVDSAARTIRYAKAGHPAPILLSRAGKSLRRLDADGKSDPALGVLAGASYTAHSVAIEPDDRLLLFTDGLTEAEDPAGEAFGEPRLEQTAASNARHECGRALGELLDTLRGFAGRSDFDDDICLLSVDFTPGPSTAPAAPPTPPAQQSPPA